jgi:hypothetical protein
MTITAGGSNDIECLPSTSNSTSFTVANNTVTQQQDKQTNGQDQKSVDISNSPVPHERPKPPSEVASNSSDPALVEKLMQQLNDLKEMVYVL